MPFAYYGAKHALARKYPAPAHDTIVEPFAGSAAYSCYWGAGRNVILVEKNKYIADLWRRLQRMSAADVDKAVADALSSDRTNEPLVAFCGGGSQIAGLCTGRDQKVTPRMRRDCIPVAKRVKKHLEMIAGWSIINGDYIDAPNINATWFIDPPYQPLISSAGAHYVESAAALNYQALAEWCRSRQGQVIVCEQHPAAWLPFVPFAKQLNAASSAIRTEVIWQNTKRNELTLWE